MKRKLTGSLAAIAGLLLVSSTLVAHHGTSVTYQVDKTITLNGVVTSGTSLIRIHNSIST